MEQRGEGVSSDPSETAKGSAASSPTPPHTLPLDDLSDELLEDLIRAGRRESQHLDFKRAFDLSAARTKLDYLKDVSAFANAGGALIIIGVADDGADGAGIVVGVESGTGLARKLKDLVVEHIAPRLAGIETRARVLGDKELVLVRIPAAAAGPAMVSLDENTHFAMRYDDGKRSMTWSEIRSAFTEDEFGLRLARMEQAISAIAAQPKSAAAVDVAGLSAAEDAGVYGSSSGRDAIERLTLKLTSWAGRRPFFWIAAAPSTVRAGVLPFRDQGLQRILLDAPGSRRHGWSMAAFFEPVSYDGAGIYRERAGTMRIDLRSDGVVAFRTLIDDTYLWRQSAQDQREQPRLYPFPVIEYPTTFLRLAAALFANAGVDEGLWVAGGYRSIKGMRLHPGAPGEIRFDFADSDEGIYPSQELAIEPSCWTLSDLSESDRAAYRFVQLVYESFGYGDESIPFYAPTSRKFDFGQ